MTQAYNLAILANAVDTSGRLNVGTNATGTLPVANGGTGTTTPSLVAGTGISISGSFPNQTVTSTVTGGQLQTQLFTSGGSWTAPTGVTRVEVLVIAGGGGSNGYNVTWGGGGGFAHALCTVSPGTSYTVTVGTGGTYQGGNAPAGSGGTSSFGSLVSATGGSGAPNSGSETSASGNNGSGTVSSGTTIRTGNIYFGKLAYQFMYVNAGGDPVVYLRIDNDNIGYIFTGSTRQGSNQTYSTSSSNPAGAGGNIYGSTGNGGIVFLRWVG